LITIQIDTENDAFQDDPFGEIARLLDYIATHVQERYILPTKLYDINGNVCGSVKETTK